MDATLGGGGHARLLAEAIRPGGRLLGIDRDPAAIERCAFLLQVPEIEVELVQGDFSDLERLAGEAGLGALDGVLFDLGVSSFQFDAAARGFSFRNPGPLDMRMDPRTSVTAEQLVNRMDRRSLGRLIRELGEDRWAERIAEFIVRRRPLHTTGDLAAAVEAAIPRRAWPREIHPATRTFQAIRMAVNDELGALERGLKAATSLLRPGGRMAAISFHSLEDRLVKAHVTAESKDCSCPPQQPVCTCAHRATLRPITRRPITPTLGEIQANPRVRSAKLRVAERI